MYIYSWSPRGGRGFGDPKPLCVFFPYVSTSHLLFGHALVFHGKQRLVTRHEARFSGDRKAKRDPKPFHDILPKHLDPCRLVPYLLPVCVCVCLCLVTIEDGQPPPCCEFGGAQPPAIRFVMTEVPNSIPQKQNAERIASPTQM